MSQNNTTLLVLGVTLAIIAMLAVAPVLNNDEMAYAGRGNNGADGTTGHASTHITCTATGCTVSANATGGRWR
jgi:hypothetical protein